MSHLIRTLHSMALLALLWNTSAVSSAEVARNEKAIADVEAGEIETAKASIARPIATPVIRMISARSIFFACDAV